METSTPCFADLLRLISPRLPPVLVSSDRQALLQQLATHLPPVYCGGFEVRLGPKSGRVDLHQCIAAADDQPRSFLDFLADTDRMQHPCWKAIAGLFRDWIHPVSPLHDCVSAVWLEFDVANPEYRLPIPKIFIRLRGGSRERPHRPPLSFLAKSIAASMGSEPAFDGLDSAFARIEKMLPGTATVSHMGFHPMPSRSPWCRLNIDGVAPPDLRVLSDALEWPHPINALIRYCSSLYSLAESVVFSVDATEQKLGEIGLECFLPEQPGKNHRCRSLFAKLVREGFCTEEQREALFAWPDRLDPAAFPLLWPDRLVIESLLRPASELSCVLQNVTHIKIRWGSQGPFQAKAYFGAEHVWIPIRAEAADKGKRDAH